MPRAAAATPRRCCCARPRRSSRSIRSSRARPTWTRGARRCSRAGSRDSGGLGDVSAGSPGRAPTGARPACVRPPPRRLCAAAHRRTRRRGAGPPARSDRLRRHGRVPRGSAPLGLARHGGCGHRLGLRDVRARSPTARSKSPATRARSPCWPIGANVLAQAVALGGEFGKASLVIAEADAVVEATGTGVLPYGALVLAGLQGREAEASVLIDATITRGHRRGAGNRRPVRPLGERDPAQRPRPLRRGSRGRAGCERRRTRAVRLRLGAERADRGRRPERADGHGRQRPQRLTEHARASPTDWGLGIVARSSALLSEGKEAERLFRAAIERLDRTRLRPERARAHMLYGEWLRRENRRVEAREQLRVAHDMLAGIGMEAFAERARRELAATGGKVRKRSAETRDDLTDQERQIAQLARGGLSNPEIGARLFLSPRTVEWHLHKVFGKLGIRSRRELDERAAGRDRSIRRHAARVGARGPGRRRAPSCARSSRGRSRRTPRAPPPRRSARHR